MKSVRDKTRMVAQLADISQRSTGERMNTELRIGLMTPLVGLVTKFRMSRISQAMLHKTSIDSAIVSNRASIASAIVSSKASITQLTMLKMHQIELLRTLATTSVESSDSAMAYKTLTTRADMRVGMTITTTTGDVRRSWKLPYRHSTYF